MRTLDMGLLSLSPPHSSLSLTHGLIQRHTHTHTHTHTHIHKPTHTHTTHKPGIREKIRAYSLAGTRWSNRKENCKRVASQGAVPAEARCWAWCCTVPEQGHRSTEPLARSRPPPVRGQMS